MVDRGHAGRYAQKHQEWPVCQNCVAFWPALDRVGNQVGAVYGSKETSLALFSSRITPKWQDHSTSPVIGWSVMIDAF
jgi:hypothetical protein